ncbi:MAG TPA: hypothetical protein VFW34_00465 [Candidatus Rubrimentiphilum sp.]|nr:hypothetical protein [Candidatus Rubrimentiphilum sp.]
MSSPFASIIGTGERIAVYDISDTEMAIGSTLGAPRIAIIIKATGAIDHIYAPDAGQAMLGTIVVHHWDEESGINLRPKQGSFHIQPDRQEHVFELSNGVEVTEQVFVLNSKPVGDELDPPAAFYLLTLKNDTEKAARIATYAFAQLKGSLGSDVKVSYDKKRHAFVVTNHSQQESARVFGALNNPESYEVGHDHGKASADSAPGPLSCELEVIGSDPLGTLHFSSTLKPHSKVRIGLKIAFSLEGAQDALRLYEAAGTGDAAREATREYYASILERTVLITPDAEVNRGVLWAKANMLRVLLRAPTGWCFVNDPTRSNNSVARDTAWFAMGADFILPQFARESLLWYVEHLEPSGKVIEYYDVRNGAPADYRLNINDDTPLLILALWHHYNTSGDRDFLAHVYPRALKAARYILSQRNDQGLVWCTADGVADWGIVGWRNVIDGYRLSGATTELNSECFAALRTIAQMARVLDKGDDDLEFQEHARGLRAAINTHLFDPDRRLYYLNIDVDGSIGTDVTADLVFPVMFGVADNDVAAHIISKLSVAEFWTAAGIRTVPRTSPMYSPTFGYGLLGGVWSNATFWFAMAAAHFNPEFMASALSTSFKHYAQDPRRSNTVPGQFSEWLHGETLSNRGMMLSPWFPPHYLWAAIEGPAGLNLAFDVPSVTPRLAPDWKWLGVRNVLFRGKRLSWFAIRQPDLRTYSTFAFEGLGDGTVFDSDCSKDVQLTGADAAAMALKRGNDYTILVGNTTDRTITTALCLKVNSVASYHMRSYSSLRGEWVDQVISAEDLQQGRALELDRHGFCALELRPA